MWRRAQRDLLVSARLGIGGADKWGECWFRGWEEAREDNGTTVAVLEKGISFGEGEEGCR